MYQAIGQHTNTLYASGSKADCVRALNRMYASFLYQPCNLKTTSKKVCEVLPEPIVIQFTRVNSH